MSDEDDSTDGRYPYGGAPARSPPPGRPTPADEDWRRSAAANRRATTGAPVSVAQLVGAIARGDAPFTGGLPERSPDGQFRCRRCGEATAVLLQALDGGPRVLCGCCVGKDARARGDQIRAAGHAYRAGGADARRAAQRLVDLMGRSDAENWMAAIDAKRDEQKGGSW